MTRKQSINAIALVLGLPMYFYADTADRFIGEWSARNGGVTTIQIQRSNDQLRLHAYGSCHPTDCGWGEVDAQPYAPRVDLRDSVVRDVRTAWLATNTAFQRVTVSQELAKQTDLSLSLAQQRYQLGLGSIVELSQAQLQQTDAAIAYVNARYQYRLALSSLNFQIGVQP